MYRKDILMGILLICLVFNMGACSPSQPMEDLQEQETAEAFDPVEHSYIALYEAFLDDYDAETQKNSESGTSPELRFDLIYLDEDEIPELVLYSAYEEMPTCARYNACFCTIKDEQVVSIQEMENYCGVSKTTKWHYIPYANVFWMREDWPRAKVDTLYRMEDGKMTAAESGCEEYWLTSQREVSLMLDGEERTVSIMESEEPDRTEFDALYREYQEWVTENRLQSANPPDPWKGLFYSTAQRYTGTNSIGSYLNIP